MWSSVRDWLRASENECNKWVSPRIISLSIWWWRWWRRYYLVWPPDFRWDWKKDLPWFHSWMVDSEKIWASRDLTENGYLTILNKEVSLFPSVHEFNSENIIKAKREILDEMISLLVLWSCGSSRGGGWSGGILHVEFGWLNPLRRSLVNLGRPNGGRGIYVKWQRWANTAFWALFFRGFEFAGLLHPQQDENLHGESSSRKKIRVLWRN